MSLLEDVFLEDEADEAQELERVIEGDDEIEDIRKSSDVDSLSGEEAGKLNLIRVAPTEITNKGRVPKLFGNDIIVKKLIAFTNREARIGNGN